VNGAILRRLRAASLPRLGLQDFIARRHSLSASSSHSDG
jgi:hypothetical protein